MTIQRRPGYFAIVVGRLKLRIRPTLDLFWRMSS